MNKQPLTLEQTVQFDEAIDVVGYDQWYNDLWILQPRTIIRFTISSYSLREYEIPNGIHTFAIDQDYVYLVGQQDYALEKRTGEVTTVNTFPDHVTWYGKSTSPDLQNYPFLMPYYYTDEQSESQDPFRQFPITALYDDGMFLYVGTQGYGLLKYNKVSWQKQRSIYGPLDLRIRSVRKFSERIYFVTAGGISYYTPGENNWTYQRFTRDMIDIVPLQDYVVVSFQNRLSRIDGSMVTTISNFPTSILSVSEDEKNVYVGTRTGLFKIIKGTNESVPFGPDRYAVYAIHPTANAVFVGDEFAFYRYDRAEDAWSRLLQFGIKDIVEITDDMYLLGVNNQLIRYRDMQTVSEDTNWILLPYFNIYDIDTDNDVLYCASHAGMYYYEPTTELYKVIYNLPREKYDNVFVINDTLITSAERVIYKLPITYRD
jgi:hypothetical protein